MKRALTYFLARNCYKKKRYGKVYYIGRGSDKDTDANYRRAWTEWEAMLAGIVAAEAEGIRKRGGWFNPDGTLIAPGWGPPETVAAIQAAQRATNQPLPEEPPTTPAQDAETLRKFQRSYELSSGVHWIKADRASEARKIAMTEAGVHTVGEMVAKFLDHKRTQARTGQKSIGRFANLNTDVKAFGVFVGDSKPIQAVDAVALSDWYGRLLKEMEAKRLSPSTARGRLQVARQFIRWCWELSLIELPRNIDSREMVIGVTPGNVEPMPVECWQERVAAADGQLRLALLLMANAGMTQVDISELQHTEIDWKDGTITRKRSKTKNHAHVPTVTYYLWAPTLDLLRQCATKDEPYVLATRTGEQATRQYFSAEGKPIRTDATGQAYTKLQNNLEAACAVKVKKMSKDQIKAAVAAGALNPDKTYRRWALKSIRKAGATALGGHPDYARYAAHYLGHAPETVADAHYVKPSPEQFKKACEWLGEHFKVADIKK